MSRAAPGRPKQAAVPSGDRPTYPSDEGSSRLRAPWRELSDAALLAHFRSDRGIRFEPVIDAGEIGPERMAGILAGRFEFNGETHALAEPIDWLANPSRDVEWHILLHKFYYAVGLSQAWQHDGNAHAVQRWSQLIDGWIAQTPVGFIAADVTGRRVQNWIYSLHGLLPNAPIDAAFLRRMLHSLHDQVEFLCANLTPKRNHRTLELLAIFLAGVVFPEFGLPTRPRRRSSRPTPAGWWWGSAPGWPTTTSSAPSSTGSRRSTRRPGAGRRAR